MFGALGELRRPATTQELGGARRAPSLYRDAVRQNQAVVCRLHRGITTGLVERIDPRARLEGFVAKDPYAAGCLIELDGVASAG